MIIDIFQLVGRGPNGQSQVVRVVKGAMPSTAGGSSPAKTPAGHCKYLVPFLLQ